MNATELSQRVQFVVDAEGHKSAVLVSVDDLAQNPYPPDAKKLKDDSGYSQRVTTVS
jgi:hypothetical protein